MTREEVVFTNKIFFIPWETHFKSYQQLYKLFQRAFTKGGFQVGFFNHSTDSVESERTREVGGSQGDSKNVRCQPIDVKDDFVTKLRGSVTHDLKIGEQARRSGNEREFTKLS